MNKQEYFDDLKEILTDEIYMGDSITELNNEISNNLWLISMPQELCSVTDKKDFLDFFEAVIENRKEQVANPDKNHGMIFYLWFDSQACQLRFNLISDFHKKLPFGCKLEIIDNFDEIIDEFFNNKYHDGLPLGNCVDTTEENDNKKEIDESEYILKVYRLDIRKDIHLRK